MEYNKEENPFFSIDYSSKVFFYESEKPKNINFDDYISVNIINKELREAIYKRYKINKLPALLIYNNLLEDINSDDISKLESQKSYLIKKIFQNLINENKIFLIMKGTIKNPYCRFFKEVVNILRAYVDLESIIYYDILMNEDFRNEIKIINQWPTFPQLFINGEFIGGCDIIRSLNESGELEALLNE